MLVLSIVMWWRIWVTGHPTSTVTCQCGDVGEALGFVAWWPWAVMHGHNPFLSNAVFAGQGGANMLVNASFGGGLLFAPVTWLFGPIATLNVTMTLAPVVSGWCCFAAVRRFTRFVPGQFAAALLYGFSPVVVANDRLGHFFQVWLFYPPLVFVVFYDLLVARRRSALRSGIAFGVLTVLQFFTSTEILVIVMGMGAIVLVTAVVLAPWRVWALRRDLLTCVGSGGALAGLVLAYPLWFASAGPRHIVGYPWPRISSFNFPASGVIDPGGFVHRPSPLATVAGYFGNFGPDPAYLGLALLSFIAVSAVVWRHNRLAWMLVSMGLWSWLLGLGSGPWWGPWRLFQHIPLISDITPLTFSTTLFFVAALLLALSADAWWQLPRAAAPRDGVAGRGPWSSGKRLYGVALAGVAIATLVPIAITYSFPFVIHQEPEPAWFRQVAPRLPEGALVLPYPISGGLTMAWQAVATMDYRIVGGFVIVPGQDGRHSEGVSPFKGTTAVLDDLSFGSTKSPPVAAPSVVRTMRNTLERWGVQVVVVPERSPGRNVVYAAAFFTDVLGRAPRQQAHAWVWYGLGTAPPLAVNPAVVTRCGSSAQPGLRVPNCVLHAH